MRRKKGFMSSSNPVLNDDKFRQAAETAHMGGGMATTGTSAEPMTVNGAINKTFILTAIMLMTTVVGFMNPNPLFIWGGAIGGLVVVIISSFKMEWSPTLAPIYAALEGLFVGGISAMYASLFNGIIFQAVTLTLALLFMMLFLYKTQIIKVTQKFRSGVMMATGAILLVYVLNFVLSFFGMNVPFLHDGGMMGIGISLLIIGVASLNLLLDFDNFEKGAQYRAPKYMEWYCAMGLIITLVWLYLEILRLIAIFSSSD